MKQKMFQKRVWVLSTIALLLFVLVPSTIAFDGRQGEKVIIGADEVIEDDLYVGADQFVLNGTVKGDVYAGGTSIEINGVIEGDLTASGQSIVIDGVIQDDVRVAGMALTIGEKAVLSDGLLFLGYSLETEKGSTIHQDVLFLGAQALLAGDISNDLTVFGEGLNLLGSVGGDAFVDVGSEDGLPTVSPFMFVPNAPTIPTIAGGLTIGEGSFIGGDFNYTVASHVDVPAGITNGEVVENIRVVGGETEAVAQTNVYLAWAATQLRYLIALLIIGGLVVWLFPNSIDRIGRPIETKPLPSLGWGFIALIAISVGLVAVLAITIFIAILFGTLALSNLSGLIIALGLYLFAGLLILFSLTVVYLTKVLVAYVGGRMILDRWGPAWADNRFVILGLGLLILVLLTAIPFIGGWINFAIVLLGLGALWMIGQGYFGHTQGTIGPSEAQKGSIQPAT